MNEKDKTPCSGIAAGKWEKFTIRPTGKPVYICTACQNKTAFKKHLFCPACNAKMINGEAVRKSTIYCTLPCKIGDEVFCLRTYNGHKTNPQKGVVSEMYFTDNMRVLIVVKNIGRGFWGERIFATEEEALKEIETEKRRF